VRIPAFSQTMKASANATTAKKIAMAGNTRTLASSKAARNPRKAIVCRVMLNGSGGIAGNVTLPGSRRRAERRRDPVVKPREDGAADRSVHQSVQRADEDLPEVRGASVTVRRC